MEQTVGTSWARVFVNVNDKTPNFDGHIELIDRQGIPLGKLDVQLKSMSKTPDAVYIPQKAYDYAETTTVPFIWVVADLTTSSCRWHIVSKKSSEYTGGKESYRVSFDTFSLIDNSGLCASAWKSLVRRYQDGMDFIVEISDQMGESLSLTGVSSNAVAFFQEFLLEFNSLINGECKIIRDRQMSGCQEVGIAVLGERNDGGSFFIYPIPRGKNWPRIARFNGDSFSRKDNKIGEHAIRGFRADQSESGRTAAKNTVKNRLEKLLSEPTQLELSGPLLVGERVHAESSTLNALIGSDYLGCGDSQVVCSGISRFLEQIHVAARNSLASYDENELLCGDMTFILSGQDVCKFISENLVPHPYRPHKFNGPLEVRISQDEGLLRRLTQCLEAVARSGTETLMPTMRKSRSEFFAGPLVSRQNWKTTDDDFDRIDNSLLSEAFLEEYCSFLEINSIDSSRSLVLDQTTTLSFCFKRRANFSGGLCLGIGLWECGSPKVRCVSSDHALAMSNRDCLMSTFPNTVWQLTIDFVTNPLRSTSPVEEMLRLYLYLDAPHLFPSLGQVTHYRQRNYLH